MSEGDSNVNVMEDYVQTTIWRKQQECYVRLNNTQQEEIDGLFCPGLFDGWVCWPDTAAGEAASAPCPEFIIGFDPSRKAYKICEETGEWFFHEEYNKTWSNYTTCINKEDLWFRQMIVTLYIVGYSISLVALLSSLGILTYFKSLRCARITIHMNLFGSFTINNFLWILWYNLVVKHIDVIKNNEVWCRGLHAVLMLFLISNYSWMLGEGLYLHTVLVSAFISETKLLRCMLLLGWGLPIIFVVPYAYLRYTFEDQNDVGCWMDDGKFFILLQIPVAVSIFLNLVFLANILRVLYVKLRQQPQGGSGASRASLQALRATLLLVPLLGLNFLLTPFRPDKDGFWEYLYEVVQAVTASLQGLCVAILFCFFNGEVLAQMKRKWRAATFRPRANSCTVTTVSDASKKRKPIDEIGRLLPQNNP
ncbi:PREDICTED: calcitonin gene-related peptide type 1 receptor isoform X2 [Nicrophorus vespilloides]|uniref:Calcitonin gene-related peptide type 1 receptor isoform X2 n=1 Tax=Nicrophorus vespilloides TaxID=110193 RepID=A0ABM1MA21_NICVS|nr:PREDICTED: calcitonin gene-related peptide type 1 receptor isoform X2 [Nicrophorus vespilloides]